MFVRFCPFCFFWMGYWWCRLGRGSGGVSVLDQVEGRGGLTHVTASMLSSPVSLSELSSEEESLALMLALAIPLPLPPSLSLPVPLVTSLSMSLSLTYSSLTAGAVVTGRLTGAPLVPLIWDCFDASSFGGGTEVTLPA